MFEGLPIWLGVPVLILGWIAGAMLLGWMWEQFIGRQGPPQPPE